jgi:GNAT superfamily N-acetyltransferase
MITITNTRPEHAVALAEHQRVCFPTLAPHELMTAEHFLAHLQLFAAGQHVALDGARVVGQSSTFRIGPQVFGKHTFTEIMAGGWFTNHDPQGEWLYGADMSIHPDYRGMKLSKQLYAARKDLIQQLGLRGMVAGGMIPGYPRYRDQLSVVEYVDAVVAGEIADPTLTPQLRSGFQVHGILYDYIEAGALGNDGVLIVWDNPDHS